MKLLLRYFFSILIITLSTSCIDKNNDEPEYTDPVWEDLDKLDPSKFYDLTVEEWTGFDGAVYHNGAYIAYKTDEVNKVFVYYVSRHDITDPDDGVFEVLNFDGTLLAFGHPGRIMFACEDVDGAPGLIAPDDNGDIKLITTGKDTRQSVSPANVASREDYHGYEAKSWINFGLSNVKGLGDVMTVYDLGNAWVEHDTFKFTTTAFTAGVSYVGGPVVGLAVGAIVNEWEQECEELLWRLYGNAQPEIEEVIPLGNDQFEVVVHIRNAQDLAKPYTVNIEDNFGCRSLSTPRQIFLGVTGCNVKYGDIDLAYAISDEVMVENDEGSEDIRMSAKIHIPKGKRLYLRPYLISYIKLLSENTAFINSVKFFKRQYRYGPDYIYVNAGIDLHWRQVNAKSVNSSYSDKRSIDFQIEVIADQFELKDDEYGQVGVFDWGYVIVDDKGRIFDSFSFKENNSDGDINATTVCETVNYTIYEDKLTVDETSYYAGLVDWHICPYICTNVDPETLEFREIYGEPQPFDLLYSQVPNITYTGCEYYSSFMLDIYVSGKPPVLINSEENIYANAQSDFSITTAVKGAFFIKRATYKETGTNKYCLWHSDIFIDNLDDGEITYNDDFWWNNEHFDNAKPVEFSLEYELTNGLKFKSNTVVLNPIPHIDDKGKTYYFGFKPSIR